MPLKRNVSFQEFSIKHYDELLLSWKIKQGLAKGIDVERIARYCKHYYESCLSKHIEEEEKYIVSKFGLKDPDTQKLLKDHKQLKLIIDGLGRDPINTLDFLQILVNELDSHIRREEDIYLLRLEKELYEESMQKLFIDENKTSEETDREEFFW